MLEKKAGFSRCGNVGVQEDADSNSPRRDSLNCSAPNQSGEIVSHRNHLQLEEDSQFKRGSTAVSRLNVWRGTVDVESGRRKEKAQAFCLGLS